MPQSRATVPVACGLIAVVATLAAMLPALRPAGWSLTILPRVEAGTGMAAVAKRHDPGFKTVPTGGYDGQWYWGIAIDPIGTGDAHQAFDDASYRYGHPMLGWLGWALSGGQARAAPAALTVVGLLSIVAAAVAASLLGISRGSQGWEGLFVAANPGLVYSAAHFLSEPLSAALLLGGLLAWTRDRRVAAAVCFGFLVLAREQFVVVPLAVAGWELWRGRARLRDLVPYVACLLPAAGWWIYARLQLGAWFTSARHSAFGLPLSGWRRALLDAGIETYSTDGRRAVSAEAALVVFVCILVLLAVGGVLALRLRSPVDPIYLLTAIIVACLSPIATVLLRDALRNTAVLLALIPFVIAGAAIRRGSGPAPPG